MARMIRMPVTPVMVAINQIREFAIALYAAHGGWHVRWQCGRSCPP
jgi:hypothetical protein